MRKTIMGTALALSLALAGTAQADVVKSLDAPWKASNSTVQKVTGGVHFGTYANGGALGGSLMYSGANGLKLSDVNDFSYTFNYRQAGNTTGAAPYARIFLDTDPTDGSNSVDADVILDPSFCATVLPPQSTDLTYQMVGDSVRYNDDGCDGVAPDQQNWADVVADHGDDVITNVLVSQGNSTGADVSAMVKRITFNGEAFDFTGAPADGQNGKNGVNGTNGVNGVNGVNGKDGINSTTTLRGASIRQLHIRKISGMKFVSAKATMGGKRLSVKGRTVKVDLRGKSVGEYRVVITAKYKAYDKVSKVRSTRTLSIIRK